MEKIDFVGLAGLVTGLAALIIAIFGIKDVRDQVRFLITLERNRVWSRILHSLVWRVVERTEDLERFQLPSEMHEFTMLVRALEPSQTMDSVQEYANNEVLAFSRELVSRGLATWRPDIDENNVEELLRGWQSEKNAAVLSGMFRDRYAPLSGPAKKML